MNALAMTPTKDVRFGDFRLDPANECLWRGVDAISLRPKAFGVLTQLLAHPGQLVTKQHLLEAVWPGTFVGDAVLKVTIRQLREALGDDADSPAYIETSHRRGYRFIAHISEDLVRHADAVPRRAAAQRTPCWDAKQRSRRCGPGSSAPKRGERQIVFVTGEAGIGKTTLVNALLEQIAAAAGDVDRARAVPRAVRRRGGVPSGARRRLATRAQARRPADHGICCVSTRRPGCSSCRRSFRRRTGTRCSGRSWRDTRAHAARDGRRHRGDDRRGSVWSWFSKTCTGATTRRSISSRTWPVDAIRRD